MSVLLGASGWSYDDWVGPFYPPGTVPRDYLAHYAKRFGAVEIDSTFYAIPALATVQGWADRTPEGFLFAPKIPGTVTHGAQGERPVPDRVLVDAEGQLEVFLHRASVLGPKLACVVFQFPYFRVKEFSLSQFLPRLASTLARLPAGVRAAVEVRNRTWIVPDYLALLQEHRAAAVLVDHPYMPFPEEQIQLGMVTTDFAYLRLLGDRYAIEKKTKTWGATVEDRSERLGRWAQIIRSIASRSGLRDVYAFSNNHFAGHAPATCIELGRLVGTISEPS